MRTITVALLLALALSPSIGAQPTEASQAIRDQMSAFQKAWNAHDAASLSAIFESDADQIMASGPRTRGRTAIEAWWRDQFAHTNEKARISIAVMSLRLLRPDVAILNTSADVTQGGSSPSESNTGTDRGTLVLTRQNGRWLIAALRVFANEGVAKQP